MSDDYLWDGTESPGRHTPAADRDVARLERLLRPLRTPLPPPPPFASLGHVRSVPAPRRNQSAARPYLGIRFLAPALAAAAAIVLMVLSASRTAPPPTAGRSWDVAQMDGLPRLGSAPLRGTGRIAVGQTLATDSRSRARIDVSTIGQVTVDNDTRVRLVATREGRHELALERGTLHAFISAPPGQFIVNTPSSTAIDLGCVYTLTVDEDGTGLLSVTAGWVAFEYQGRESFVPARASARTDPGFGPGTPRYDDADERFREALDRFDSSRDAATRSQALAYTLEHARARDAMTLWHLIARASAADRPAVVDALAARVPMPIGATRDAVLNLDRSALDLWWDALGLQNTTWWRQWKRPVLR